MVVKNWHELSLITYFSNSGDRSRLLKIYQDYAKIAHPAIKIDRRRNYSSETIIGMMAELYNHQVNRPNPEVVVEKLDKYNAPMHYQGRLENATICGCLSQWQAHLGAHLVDVYYCQGIRFKALVKELINGKN